MPKYTRVVEVDFAVQGTGVFPVDMLRYDCAVPVSEEDSNKITRGRSIRTIHLRRFSTSDTPPTHERWASFGWQVLRIETEALPDIFDAPDTFPKAGSGCP